MRGVCRKLFLNWSVLGLCSIVQKVNLTEYNGNEINVESEEKKKKENNFRNRVNSAIVLVFKNYLCKDELKI